MILIAQQLLKVVPSVILVLDLEGKMKETSLSCGFIGIIIIIIIYLPLCVQQIFKKHTAEVVRRGDLRKPPGL